jgi:hypothetical protein
VAQRGAQVGQRLLGQLGAVPGRVGQPFLDRLAARAGA